MKKGNRRIRHRSANKLRELFAKKQPYASESSEAAESVASHGSDESPLASVHPSADSSGGGHSEGNGARKQEETNPNPYEQEQLRLTRSLIRATIAIALATVVYMVFSGYQSYKLRQSVEIAQVSARAAEDSATIARQVYEAGQQPQIYVIRFSFAGDLAVGQIPLVRIAFGNSGRKAHNIRVPLAIAIRPRSFEGSLRDDLIRDTNPTQLEQNETTTIVPEYTFNLTEDQFKAIVGGESLLIFYGWVQYEDNRNLPHSFPICHTYSRAIFPDLGGCPEAIKVPEPKNKQAGANPN